MAEMNLKRVEFQLVTPDLQTQRTLAFFRHQRLAVDTNTSQPFMKGGVGMGLIYVSKSPRQAHGQFWSLSPELDGMGYVEMWPGDQVQGTSFQEAFCDIPLHSQTSPPYSLFP